MPRAWATARATSTRTCFAGHFIPQQYLPTELLGTTFYEPSDQGYEARIAERLAPGASCSSKD